MIKSYANALKGNSYDEKENIEENDMIENDIFIHKPKDNLPSDEVYSYFLARVMDLDINHIMTDWKIINPRAIRILEEDTMKIENILQR